MTRVTSRSRDRCRTALSASRDEAESAGTAGGPGVVGARLGAPLRASIRNISVGGLLVHSEDLVLAVPAAHPLAGGDGPVSLVDVTDDYIGYSPEGSQYLHDICAAMIGMDRYAVSQLASQVPTMLALVRAGFGCALIPRSIKAMGVEGVRYRELDPADAHSVTLHACWSPDSPNPALRRLAESLRANPHLDA